MVFGWAKLFFTCTLASSTLNDVGNNLSSECSKSRAS